ncbi:MAG: S-adenosylmethionine:tRNA ribosyltransferase-isomerase [Bacteroidota bacterium]
MMMDQDPGRLRIEDFQYELPEDRIALYPLEKREQAKLLSYRAGNLSDHVFADLPAVLPQGVQLVMNNTRVIPARLRWPIADNKGIEILLLEPETRTDPEGTGTRWWCMVGNNRAWKSGELCIPLKAGELNIQRLEPREGQWLLEFTWQPNSSQLVGPQTFEELLEEIGEVPLPPYLNRPTEELDRERYQTTYATEHGAVAAPTAGLHLTSNLLQEIAARGGACHSVTLHVGAGTFLPVKAAQMAEHTMHSERISCSVATLRALRSAQGPLYAVGTTTLRMLESLYWMACMLNNDSKWPHPDQWVPYSGIDQKKGSFDGDSPGAMSAHEALDRLIHYAQSHGLEEISGRTSLLIAPPYRPRMVQGLITNFHQPRSTLLLLVAALVGDEWRQIYQHALDHQYRFLSYGDGSVLHF